MYRRIKTSFLIIPIFVHNRDKLHISMSTYVLLYIMCFQFIVGLDSFLDKAGCFGPNDLMLYLSSKN